MYFLRKIHKTPMTVRPIVSGSAENLSQFLDYFVSPHIEKTRDSNTW